MSIEVLLWGQAIGVLGYSQGQTEVATFEFYDLLLNTDLQISPNSMEHQPSIHQFDTISKHTFKGLPGIFADSLPDKFGNQLIDIFMAEKQVSAHQVTALDRLAYIGERGMGALSYRPSQTLESNPNEMLNLKDLNELANLVIQKKETFAKELHSENHRAKALNLVRVGSSAGGARAKALVATDKDFKLYDGTVIHKGDYVYWLLKFDSESNSDRDKNDPKGMPRVEYIYSLIARSCGIEMPNTSYIEIEEEFHFLIEHFDRVVVQGEVMKLHYASWSALAHADRDTTGAYSYEQLVLLMRQMQLPQNQIVELYRRAIFNVIGINHDDHTKNFGFLMNQGGEWRLSPAFDMTYSYDPSGKWTKVHQIKLNNKQSNFIRGDLLAFAKYCDIKPRAANAIIDKTIEVFRKFTLYADKYKVSHELKETINSNLLLNI
jgi:serine/threonine-protein kinase HipA